MTQKLVGGGGPIHRKPRWDGSARCLFLGKELIRKYAHNAYSQMAILQAFQTENWPKRIDNPFRNQAGHHCKERLRRTVENLNRHVSFIHFWCDYNGGVCWGIRD